MKTIWLLCFIFFFVSLAADDSELTKLIKGMEPNTWAELKTSNHDKNLMKVNVNGYHIAGWTDDGVWDEKNKMFLFMGFRQGLKFISYSENSNSWKEILPLPEWPIKDNFGHVYGNNAFDEKRGIYYHHFSATNLVTGFNFESKKWDLLPAIPNSPGQLATGIEYFPDADCLFRHANDGLWYFSFKTKEWVKIGKIAVCGYHSLLRYNPLKKEVLFVGGSHTPNAVVRIDKDLKVTELTSTPVPLNIRFERLIVNPINGHYLFIKENELYDFDSETGIYTKVPDFKYPFAATEMPVPATVYSHKVIFFVDNKVMIYKPLEIKAEEKK